MSDMCSWALYYQKMGLSIIPVKEKLPLIKWKEFQERCASEEEIKEWWTQWPEADIGMVTGEKWGILVLDCDGEEGRKSLESRQMGSTRTTQTRRGYQYHFKFPKGFCFKTTLAGILPGLDVRGEGGYVKLAPSRFNDGSGRYTWLSDLGTPLAEAPQWLIDKLSEKKEYTANSSERKEPWIEEILGGVGEGKRHQALCKLFGYYANTMPLSVAAAHIREWNSRNTPPYPESELEEQIAKWLEAFKRGEYSSNYKEPEKPVGLINFNVNMDTYLEELKKRSQYLKPEFSTGFPSLDRLTRGFPRQNLYVIGAPTNGGKTQFILASILSLLQQGKKVLYFTTEMPQNEIVDRFNAIGAGIPLKQLTEGHLTADNKQKLVKFLTTTDTSNFIVSPDDTPSLESVVSSIEEVKPDIMIFDHLHHIKSTQENKRFEIDTFIQGLKKSILKNNIPCVITAQLRRKENITVKENGVFVSRPPIYTMHDFKESGGIENEAGVCLLLCPPNKWTEDRFQIVTAYIPKNRHGRREMRFPLEFDTEVCVFKEPVL